MTHLNPEAKYEKLAEAFGGEGFSVENVEDLEAVCRKIFNF